MNGADPNRWPIRLVDFRSPGIEVDCGMVEFTTRLLRGEFDAELFGGPDPNWRTRRRFVHHAEDRRLRSEGIDPWR